MYLKTNYLKIIPLALSALLALGFAFELKAADAAKADGTWTWTMQGRNGGPDRKMTLKLKTEGNKVTGKVSSPGREGATTETEIKEGTIKDNEVTFKVVREFNGNKMESKYTAKITGDTMKGKVETERNGQTRSRDWEAKRETAKKAS